MALWSVTGYLSAALLCCRNIEREVAPRHVSHNVVVASGSRSRNVTRCDVPQYLSALRVNREIDTGELLKSILPQTASEHGLRMRQDGTGAFPKNCFELCILIEPSYPPFIVVLVCAMCEN
jgi:hypothetical protein